MFHEIIINVLNKQLDRISGFIERFFGLFGNSVAILINFDESD